KKAPVCSTNYTQSYCLVTGLPFANYPYRFLVRAVNTSNFEDSSTTEGRYYDANGIQVAGGVRTLDHAVTDFRGIVNVSRLGGTTGLNSLKVSWLPAGQLLGQSPTGYAIYC